MAGIAVGMRAAHREKSIAELADILKNGMDAELVYESQRNLGDSAAHVLSFERFYFRNGSYASLTVVLTENGDCQSADIIGSGGGEGLFNISMGANWNFANMAFKLLEQHGFREEQ